MTRKLRLALARLEFRGRVGPGVGVVVLEGFFTRLGFGIVTFALPLYALHLGMSLTQVGLIAGAKALVEPVAKPIMGVFVDRFGSRRGYLAAVILRFFASLLLLTVSTPSGLVLVRILQGAASSARDPAAITFLARRSDRGLARVFSVAIGAKDLGNVSAGLVGGALLAVSGGSFSLLWWFVAGIAVVPIALVWAGLKEDPVDHETAHSLKPQLAQASQRTRLLRSPRLRRIAGLGLFVGLTAHMTHGLFQVYASQIAGLRPGQIGLIYSMSIAALLIIGPLAGVAADRFGYGMLAGARGVANAVSSLVYAILPAFGGILGARLVDDAGKAAFRPSWGALVASSARAAGPKGGRVAGRLDAWLAMGEALGPLVGGLIWDSGGILVFFSARAILGVSTEMVFGRKLRAVLQEEGTRGEALTGEGWTEQAITRPSVRWLSHRPKAAQAGSSAKKKVLVVPFLVAAFLLLFLPLYGGAKRTLIPPIELNREEQPVESPAERTSNGQESDSGGAAQVLPPEPAPLVDEEPGDAD